MISGFSPQTHVRVGDNGPNLTVDAVTREMFVRYAGASGDFNPIHWDRDYARSAGYPDVFAQGMFTAGVLTSFLTQWMGARSIRRYRVRFVGQTWPGERITCYGTVNKVYEEGHVNWADCALRVESSEGNVKITGSATCAVLSGNAGAAVEFLVGSRQVKHLS